MHLGHGILESHFSILPTIYSTYFLYYITLYYIIITLLFILYTVFTFYFWLLSLNIVLMRFIHNVRGYSSPVLIVVEYVIA